MGAVNVAAQQLTVKSWLPGGAFRGAAEAARQQSAARIAAQ
jgi:hypothetical protein